MQKTHEQHVGAELDGAQHSNSDECLELEDKWHLWHLLFLKEIDVSLLVYILKLKKTKTSCNISRNTRSIL